MYLLTFKQFSLLCAEQRGSDRCQTKKGVLVNKSVNNNTESSNDCTCYLKLKNEIRDLNEKLQHIEHINAVLVSELQSKDAGFKRLKKRLSYPLRWISIQSAFFVQKNRICFLRLKLVFILSRLFLTMPKRILTKIKPSSIALFFLKFIKMHPESLEYEIRAKLNLGFIENIEKDSPDNYFHMLAIPKTRKSVLVIDRFIPAYDKTSGALRMYSILNVLKCLGCSITFIPDDLQSIEPYASELRSNGIEVVCGNVKLETYFKENAPRFELVILSEPQAAFNFISLIRAYAVNATLIYDTVDLHWVRLERAAMVNGNPQVMAEAKYFRKIEKFLTECADVIFTVTQHEKEFLLKENPTLDVHVVPNVHDAVPGDTAHFRYRKDIMFIGHFLHEPNVDAVTYFVREMFPLLQRKLGKIKFHIVGSNPTQQVLDLQSNDVIVTGYVPDVSPYFENSRVFVAPLRFGAGMKGKIGHSMTFGLPIVTTSIGAEGMGLEDGKHLLIADNTDSFVHAVERLYTDEKLWILLSAESKNYIHKTYSTSAMESIMSKILAQIAI
jgi:glycosyltransferase involved in cell wall biosynthesis